VIRVAAACFIALFAFSSLSPASAQAGPSAAPLPQVETHALSVVAPPPLQFDPEKATKAYLARISGKARERSDAYFEGGYWLLLVDTLYAVAVAAILLFTRVSAGMRNRAQKITRSRFWQVPIYVIQYVLVTTLLTLPLTIYEEFIREHAYGLSNQNFLQWSGDFGIESAVGLVQMLILVTIVYALIRATPKNWWMWSTVAVVFLLGVMLVMTPVFLLPLLNHYKPLPDSPVKQQILSLARANGIPANNVYEFDASRQSNRISANVSGFFGTTQISMTDNLMTQATPAEITAVLGHEMGHYVMNHQVFLLGGFGLLVLIGFGLTDWGFRRLTALFGGFWDVRSIDDPAGLPALMAIFTVLGLLGTPLENTITRTAEHEADIFGLNAARQPDGFATAALKLATYRKLEPTPLEEFIFYDHPSGRTRIHDAMVWKAEHLNDPDIKAGPISPE
jgi:STE24 endopeptidase